MRFWIWLLLALVATTGSAWGFGFSANWQRSEISGAPTLWTQNYTFSFSQELSRAMNMGGSVRYSRQSQGDTWRESWAPSIFFNLSNDLFGFNLTGTGTRSETESTPVMKSRSWSAIFNTVYRQVSINLFGNLNRQWNEASPRTVDTKSHGWGISLARRFKGGRLRNLNVTYDYRFDYNKDLVALSRTKSWSHVGRVSYSRVFYGFNFSLFQQYSFLHSESDYALGPGGRTRVGVDLSFNGTPPSLIQVGDQIVVISNREIQGLEFYRDWANRISIPGTYRWNIYYSADGLTWNTLASGVALPYEFSSPLDYRYYKLEVVSGPPAGGEPLPDPRVRGFYYVTEGHTESETTHYQGNLSLSRNFPRNIYTGYYFSYDITSPKKGPEEKRFNHSFSSSWTPNKYFRPRFTVSYNLDDKEDRPREETWTYSLGIGSDPLETVSISGAYTYFKHWVGGEPTSQNEAYSLGTQMELYPDLILKINAGYNRNQSFGNATSVTRTYSTTWDLVARLRPEVTVDFRVDYSRSKPSGGETSTSKRYTGTLNWRISDILFFNTIHTLTDSDGTTQYTYNYAISLAPTPKIRLSGGWSGSRDDTNTDTYSVNLFWDLGPHINFNTNYAWTKTDGDTSWSWFINLSLVF